MKIKVAYNACYGGFSLSRAAILRAREISGDPNWGGPCIKGDMYPPDKSNPKGQKCDTDYGHVDHEIPRHDKVLTQVIEEMGDKANGQCAKLRVAVVSGPYRVDEYDGSESVVEPGGYDWISPEGE